jgi:hypothetical protein
MKYLVLVLSIIMMSCSADKSSAPTHKQSSFADCKGNSDYENAEVLKRYIQCIDANAPGMHDNQPGYRAEAAWSCESKIAQLLCAQRERPSCDARVADAEKAARQQCDKKYKDTVDDAHNFHRALTQIAECPAYEDMQKRCSSYVEPPGSDIEKRIRRRARTDG